MTLEYACILFPSDNRVFCLKKSACNLLGKWEEGQEVDVSFIDASHVGEILKIGEKDVMHKFAEISNENGLEEAEEWISHSDYKRISSKLMIQDEPSKIRISDIEKIEILEEKAKRLEKELVEKNSQIDTLKALLARNERKRKNSISNADTDGSGSEPKKVELAQGTGVMLPYDLVLQLKLQKTPGDAIAYLFRSLYTIDELSSMSFSPGEGQKQLPPALFKAAKLFTCIEFNHMRKKRNGEFVKLDDGFFRETVHSLIGNAKRYRKKGKVFKSKQNLTF